MHALFRVFSPMLSRGELQKPKKATAEDKKATVTLWLRENYVKYLNRMCAILDLPEAGLQVPALKILLDIVKLESAHLSTLSGAHHFANDLYLNIVDALLNCNNMSAPLLGEFTQKYFGFYDDLRFYFLKNAAQIINAALGSKSKKDNKAPLNKVIFQGERKTGQLLAFISLTAHVKASVILTCIVFYLQCYIEAKDDCTCTTCQVGVDSGERVRYHGDFEVDAHRGQGTGRVLDREP